LTKTTNTTCEQVVSAPPQRSAPNTKPDEKRLVSDDDGEPNEWDDILAEQLSKCPPVQPRATRTMSRSIIQAATVVPPLEVTTTDESFRVTGVTKMEEGEEEDGVALVAEEERTEAEQECAGDEREGGGGGADGGDADGEDAKDGMGEDVPCQSSSSDLGYDPDTPCIGSSSEESQRQHQEQHEWEEEDEEEEGQQQKVVGLSLATKYALLLSEACEHMLDITQGAKVDGSVVRAVDKATAAASAALEAVVEATGLLGSHLTAFPDDASTRSRLPSSSPLVSLSTSEATTEDKTNEEECQHDAGTTPSPAVEGAATSSRAAATVMARRAATLTAASTLPPVVAAETMQGAEKSRPPCGGEGEGGDEHSLRRADGGECGGAQKHSFFSRFDVDVGASNGVDAGGVGAVSNHVQC